MLYGIRILLSNYCLLVHEDMLWNRFDSLLKNFVTFYETLKET